MSSKQPHQPRPNVDGLAGELSDRELNAQESASLATLLEQLTERLAGSMEAILETRLATLGETLSNEFDEKFEERLSRLSTPPDPPTSLALPSVEEFSRELESMQNRTLDRLVERLTTNLQTAIAVQLAPLSDDLPEKLSTAVASIASTHETPLVSLAQLTEQFERLENRSMASMTARLTAGLQMAIANEMEPFATHLNQRLSATIESSAARSPVLTANEEQTAISRELEPLQARLAETESQLSAAYEEQDRLRCELEHALAETINSCESTEVVSAAGAMILAPRGDEELLDRLDRATCEIIDLRSQNEELQEQISRMKVNAANASDASNLCQESMSWEDRKKMLMKQLDAEMDEVDDLPVVESKRLEMEDVIRTTELEINRRDREISELRSLLEHQSNAHQGMAVGAAAVAHLIESDELVQQEREKLRTIQLEWENKFRQTEIDISIERAKLARERLEMEEYKKQQEHILASLPTVTTRETLESTKAKSSKWLSRLGLKEEG